MEGNGCDNKAEERKQPKEKRVFGLDQIAG